MELYNGIIDSTRALLAGETPRRWAFDAADAWRDRGESELVMLRDGAFELGGSGCPSANFTCVTTKEAEVPADETLLYGPDLGEIRGDVSFARIVWISSADIGEEDAAHDAIRTMEFVRYHVFPEGYMIRISAESNQEQVRVSKQAVRGGICFRKLGNTYIRRYRENPNIRHVQVIFVTDSPLVGALGAAAKKVDDITKTLSHILDGLPTDCGHCQLKPVCDEVEGMREMHLGKNKKKA